MVVGYRWWHPASDSPPEAGHTAGDQRDYVMLTPNTATPGTTATIDRGGRMGKDDRRLYICPQCGGTQVIIRWDQANLTEQPGVEEIPTTQLCPTCDGSGHILGPPT